MSIYTPLSGANAQEQALEIIANNLANANTNGFKAEKISFQRLLPEPNKHYKEPLPPANYKIEFENLLPLRGNELAYVGVDAVTTDHSQGSSIKTENPMDVMIEGPGFFQVMTKEGMRLTRDGSFSLTQDGGLIDRFGHPVMGEKGDIFLGGAKVEINALGEVYQGETYVDRILIQDVKDTRQLEKVGTNYYFYTGENENLTQSSSRVSQGYLEASNVNAIKNLTDMITAHRSFEAYQQAIKNYDQMMKKSATELGTLQG